MVPSRAKEHAMTQAYTQRFTEVHEVPLALQIMPQLIDTGWTECGYVNMAYHQRAAIILQVGQLPVDSFAMLILSEAKDANGTDAGFLGTLGVKLVSFDEADGDSNEMSVIEVRTEEMDINNGYIYLGFMLLTLGDDVPLSVVSLLGASNNPAVPTGGWTEIV